MMYKSIITNIGSPNGINMLLNNDNDMDAAFISGNNTCVFKDFECEYSSEDSEYWSISFFDMGFFQMASIVFSGNHIPIAII